MPCNDVTELIRVELDAEDCLRGYHFIKRSCGQGVGHEALLLGFLEGMSLEAILVLDPATFTDYYPVDSDIEEFLTLKHLVAVQSVLEVLTGQSSGDVDAICAASEIAYDLDGGIRMDARISVDLVTERIASCGGCKGCGKTSKRKKKIQPVFQ